MQSAIVAKLATIPTLTRSVYKPSLSCEAMRALHPVNGGRAFSDSLIGTSDESSHIFNSCANLGAICGDAVTRHGGGGGGGFLANSNSLAYMTIGAKSEWEYDSLIDIMGALSEVETKNPT